MHEVVWNLHPETLASANNMAQMLQDLGEFQQAESFCREALEGKRATLGDTHPDKWLQSRPCTRYSKPRASHVREDNCVANGHPCAQMSHQIEVSYNKYQHYILTHKIL